MSRRTRRALVQELYTPEDADEITYDEGYDIDGGFYIPNEVLCATAFALAINPIGTTLLGIGIYKLAALISAKGAALGAKIGGMIGNVIGSAIGSLLGLGLVGSVSFIFADALIQGKGINVDWKKTWFGMPYWVDISVQ